MGKIKSNLLKFAGARWLAVVILAILVAGFVTATTALMKGRPGKAEASRPSASGDTSKAQAGLVVSQGNQKVDGGVTVGYSYHNDTSAPLRDMKPVPIKPRS